MALQRLTKDVKGASIYISQLVLAFRLRTRETQLWLRPIRNLSYSYFTAYDS